MMLEELKVGMWVKYWSYADIILKGRVKSWNDMWVFVVYYCDGDWDNFEDYTGCATRLEDLRSCTK